MPHLGGKPQEMWATDASGEAPVGWSREGNWIVGVRGECLWACAVANANDALLESSTSELYHELFKLVAGFRLQRIWHYLPRINAEGHGGLERYRAFCRGRSLAFESVFAEDFAQHLPAASAVGCEGDQLVIYACAVRPEAAEVSYLENPLQVPAYRYSTAYGPRAPGFARASLTQYAQHAHAQVQGQGLDGSASTATESSSLREIFISGTASIRKERSQTQGGLVAQLQTTLENMNCVAAQAGLELFGAAGLAAIQDDCCQQPEFSDAPVVVDMPVVADVSDVPEKSVPCELDAAQTVLPVAGQQCRRFKVYLRHGADYAEVAQRLGALLLPQDDVCYVRSDICRAELDIEIEASVTQRVKASD